ncbi:MAG: inositol monophosphatase family protein [Microthrixaceae bacterium]
MSDVPVQEALEWIREAGEVTLSHFRSVELHVASKHDGTPVTAADREAEHLLRERISERFPDDGIHGEEHEDKEGSSGRHWVIDPIDGTKAFSHGVGTYSNLLALCDSEGPLLGIINLPALGETVWAVRNRGCWINGEPTRGGAPALPGGDRVLCVTGFHDWDPALFERVGAAGVTVRTWGDAYGYALVATARAHAMFDPRLEWWDLAAPSLVVRESGGVVTRRDGSTDLAEPAHGGPYALSAIASSDGDHGFWVELLRDDRPPG